jgi:hypothetical protein
VPRIDTDAVSLDLADADAGVPATERETEFAGPTRCAFCADVIGVYEPLVLAGADGHRKTSQAAEPHLFPTSDACYHGTCFDLRAA